MFVLMLNVVSFFIGLITDNLYIISGLSFTISLLLIWLIINNQNKMIVVIKLLSCVIFPITWKPCLISKFI